MQALGYILVVLAHFLPQSVTNRIDPSGGDQERLARALTDPPPSTITVATERDGKPVVALAIHRFHVTDSVLERLIQFPQLEELTLLEDKSMLRTGHHPRWRVTDRGAAHLKELRHLRVLRIPSSLLTDRGLHHLGEMTQLEELEIGHGSSLPGEPGADPIFDEYVVADVTDAGLKSLKKLIHLAITYASGNARITDGGFAAINQFVSLQSLKLKLVRGGITEKGLAHLAKVRTLRSLEITDRALDRLDPLLDEFLAPLTKMHLHSLTILSSRITDPGLAEICLIRSLRDLTLGNRFSPARVSERGLEHLVALAELRSLQLNIREISDRGLASLSHLRNLETLAVGPRAQARCTQDGLLQLRGLSRLRELRLECSMPYEEMQERPEAFEELKKALPSIKVIR